MFKYKTLFRMWTFVLCVFGVSLCVSGSAFGQVCWIYDGTPERCASLMGSFQQDDACDTCDPTTNNCEDNDWKDVDNSWTSSAWNEARYTSISWDYVGRPNFSTVSITCGDEGSCDDQCQEVTVNNITIDACVVNGGMSITINEIALTGGDCDVGGM